MSGNDISNLDALERMTQDPLGLLSDDWAEALQPVAEELSLMGKFLRQEFEIAQKDNSGPGFLPAPKHVLRAFQQPFEHVKVLIVGQDPYPTFGHPIGLSFAVERHVHPLPRSLTNIYQELHNDLGIAPASHGDLSSWADQGVLLLNRALSVRPGTPASHRGKGWEKITETAIRALVARRDTQGRHLPFVAILWGNDARNLTPMLDGAPTIASPHPSPLSASRGFFGSRPFSRANDLLQRQGTDPVDWTVH